jgi:ribose transport system permease protein
MLPEAIAKFGIYGKESIGTVPVPVLIMGVIFGIGYFILYRTVLGQHIYAIGNHEETSSLAGIHVARTKYVVYGLCGMFAGLAGLIYSSRLSYGSPAVAGSYNFDSIIPIIMGGASLSGGKGSLTNAIVCVVIMGILTSVMNMLNVSPFIQDGVKGLVLLFAIYFLAEKRKW